MKAHPRPPDQGNGGTAKTQLQAAEAMAQAAMRPAQRVRRDLVKEEDMTVIGAPKVLAPEAMCAKRSLVWATQRFVHSATR